jgi:hypothetical protein
MDFVYKKLLQFSLVVKAGDRLREFNFNKKHGESEPFVDVNVCNERGDRIFFRMEKKDAEWTILTQQLPPWLTQSEKNISKAVEEELQHYQ